MSGNGGDKNKRGKMINRLFGVYTGWLMRTESSSLIRFGRIKSEGTNEGADVRIEDGGGE